MYEALDSYLNVDTWHTGDAHDDERFYRALAKIVRDPAFNPDSMGEYMRDRKGVDRDDPDHRGFSMAIDKRVTEAWAICDFLKLGL